MDTTYTFSYPCKTISSFCDNFLKAHYYDEVKEITYRKRAIKSDREKLLYDLFVLFQNIYSLPLDCGWEDYKNTYFKVFGIQTGNMFDWIENSNGDSLYLNLYKYFNQTNENLRVWFLCFLYLQREVSLRFGYCIVLPPAIGENCLSILDEDIGKYFLKGWLRELYSRSEYDLKNDICVKYTGIKEKLGKIGVNEIYLFGSVLKDMIHKNSDIDFIIKYKDVISMEEIKDIKKFIKEYNYSNFKRSTDIHDYYDYIENHNISDTLQII